MGPVDDRHPAVLVILDGLGDRALPELEGRTPAEAARTPVLDALAARGASGLHVPLGPGRAPASEVAHWALLGREESEFCGRAVLEALGHGVAVPDGVVLVHGALCGSQVRDGVVWIAGRAGPDDERDARELLGVLSDGAPVAALHPLGRGEAVLELESGSSPAITDSDPFFDTLYPWLRPLARAEAPDPARARRTADTLAEHLRSVRAELVGHPVNRRRLSAGRIALDTPTTKWTGVRGPLPTFVERVGIRGAAVTSSALYRGLAALLGLEAVHVAGDPDPGHDMAARLDAAAGLLERGAGFVHVHTKATDEAGHTKDPQAKLAVLEALDPALARLAQPPFAGAVVAVTGDHATPSRDGVLHTGDPTPLALAGPSVAPDGVEAFGETPARAGAVGRLAARDVLPLLLSHANRPRFLGARASAHATLALPDDVVAMRL